MFTKIKLENLRPNPFREMQEYPIDKAKVESLKASIKKTSFWDNIVVRPHPTKKGKFQIAYGHHRYKALKELGVKEISAPVRELSDDMMLKMMAEENYGLHTGPAVMIQTIAAVKKFIDNELAKCETWEQFRSHKFLRPIIKTEPEFRSVKGKGVGQTTIRKFLGKKWKGNIAEALAIINDKNLSRKAVQMLPTMYQAGVFRQATLNYKIPKPKQKEIAIEIVEEDIGGRDIPKVIRKYRTTEIDKIDEDSTITKLERTYDEIDNQARALTIKIKWFRTELEELNVKQLKGIKTFLVLTSLSTLVKTISNFFGMRKMKQITGEVK